MINKAKILKDAQKFISKGQWDKAIAEYEKIVKDAPNDANTHNIIGDLHLKKNDPDNAIESYKKAAEIFNKSGFTLKAIALYKKVLNIKADQVDIQILLGKLNAERGLVGNANECYLAAASYFSRQGQKNKAIEVYKVLCELNPGNTSLQQKLAELYHSEGFDKEAVSKFIDLADKKAEEGDYAAAAELLEKAAAKGSERFDYKRIAAFIDYRQGRLEDAFAKLVEAHRLDPNDDRITDLLGKVSLKAGRYEECIAVFRELLDKAPANRELRGRLKDAYILSGDFESAWKECVVLVEKCVSENQQAEAEGILRGFLSEKPDSLEAMHMLADLCAKMGDDSGAAGLQMGIADVYARAGERQKAENIYLRLLERDPGNGEISVKLDALKMGGIGGLSGASVSAPDRPSAAPPAHEDPEPADDAFSVFDLDSIKDEQAGEGAEPPAFELPDEDPHSFSFEEAGDDGFSTSGPAAGVDDLPETAADGRGEFAAFAEEAGEDERPAGEDIFDFSDQGTADLPEAALGEEFPAFGEETGETGRPEGGKVFDLDDSGLGDLGDILGELGGLEALTGQPEGGQAEVEGFSEKDILIKYGVSGESKAAPAPAPEPVDTRDSGQSPQAAVSGQTPAATVSGQNPAARSGSRPSMKQPRVLSFEERLEEFDVYIKYGLLNKAQDAYDSLASSFPGNPDVMNKGLEMFKATGDIDGYSRLSKELAGLHIGEGLREEAARVLDRALNIDHGNAELRAMLNGLAAPAEPQPEPEPNPVEGPAAGDAFPDMDETDALVAGGAPGPEDDEANFEDLLTEMGMSLPESDPDSGPVGEEARLDEEEAAPGAGVPEEYEDDLAEADFYAQQGLFEEAGKIYLRILTRDPDNEDLKARYFAMRDKAPASGAGAEGVEAHAAPASGESPGRPLEDSREESLDDQILSAFGESEMDFSDVAAAVSDTRPPVRETEAGPEPVTASRAKPEGDEFFDLAAELQDELDGDYLKPVRPSSSFGDSQLDEVFQEFKKGVEEQLNQEDYETHYNLGIAYKEMGMLDEALSEFLLAAKDPSRELDCASMLGLCYMEKGEFAEAVRRFKDGMEVPGRTPEEYMGLQYDLATAYELMGDSKAAYSELASIYRRDPEFRDVRERFEHMSGAAPEGPSDDPKPPSAPPKKSRVSYL